MIRHGFADVGDVTWHYAATGSGEAPLLVFAHGFPEFWYGWKSVLERLSDRFLCVAPDLTGYNLTSKPTDTARYRMGRLIEDLDRFVDAFPSHDRFTLVAHDWGGALAWAYALKRPERLRRLVIVNAVHPGAFQREVARNPDQAAASQYIHALRAADAETRYAANDFALLWASLAPVKASGHLSDDDERLYKEAWARPGALTGMFNWYRAMRIDPPRPDGSAAAVAPYDPARLTVHVPTLVIWGEQDHALLPGCIEGLDAFVPGVEILRVPEGSHWVIHERPDLVAGEIRRFSGAD
ncbi:MAG: alpha/beta fold hydrolase [Alphaproteobacteria bacterium]|nr:alpha/beta fold hydrolase [Alphaproteobacteria bacterium]